MIGKIFNWLGGGFFRTIGRFIAFICLGALVSYLLTRANVNLPNLFGFEYVKADTIKAVSYVDFYNSDQFTSRYAFSNRHQYVNMYLTDSTTLNTLDFYYHDDKRNYDYLTFNYLISGIQGETSSDNYNVSCQYSYNQWQSTGEYYQNAALCTIDDSNNRQYTVTMSAYLYSVDGTTSTTACEVYDSYFRCPVINTNANDWHLIVTYSNTSPGTYITGYSTYFQISQMITHYSYDASAIISNQNQNTQNTINAITDSNQTEVNSTASSFFENFSDTDHGGLSSIITAPLTTIQSMLSNTCVAPSATWQGATITLPCGDMFWGRPGADGLKSLVNVFYGGFICYYAIRRLFLLIENMKDPTYDKIEVVDL